MRCQKSLGCGPSRTYLAPMKKTLHVLALAGAIGLVAVLLVSPASLRPSTNRTNTTISAIPAR